MCRKIPQKHSFVPFVSHCGLFWKGCFFGEVLCLLKVTVFVNDDDSIRVHQIFACCSTKSLRSNQRRQISSFVIHRWTNRLGVRQLVGALVLPKR
jgi:hypothetical protein